MQHCLPKEITVERFLTEYWQKKPLVIRQGLPEIVGLFEPQEIIELAQQEEVTARLLQQHQADHWSFKASPLSAQDFTQLAEKWSVLVQNMEQWSTELGELWQKFSFIPQWQRDDIMVSYAPKGGSVGKHYDEYDVFLVQGYGHRRWQLGKWCDPSTEFKPNQPIRIFDDMGELVLDEVMAPGDVLYVPSRMAHYGVAQDDCLTFSFGLRYPNMAELIENINQQLCQDNPDLALSEAHIPFRLSPQPQATGELAPQDIQHIKQLFLDRLANSSQFDHLFQQALATTVSSRRYDLLVSEEVNMPEEVGEILQQQGWLSQDNNCKLIYTQQPLRIYANGEWIDELNPLESQLLKRLADGESIYWQDIQALLAPIQEKEDTLALLLDSICNWLDDGWVLLNE
ncbi:50S ribosomal protein L16 3-hydroxylase [Volucribacter psittacicida]|uniref:50S ribosomal protein L16 3-hydroxylase n=1 Tax=Volucribacter psittacicida TaxID=203482 RepID=A0A4V2PCJ5_9PAST|nr:cupin domain-containing protein [Volucribacter psittacicida]TCK01546.1 50S ribosomal protein L16 3-hydroxylase [Volucribacter psittacicida]